MPQQEQLDLLGVDLLAAPVDDVLDASLDRQVALAVNDHERGQVAGAVEPVRGECHGIVIGRVVVAPQRVGAGATQFADLPVGHFAFRTGFEDAYFIQRRQRRSHGGGSCRAGRVRPGDGE